MTPLALLFIYKKIDAVYLYHTFLPQMGEWRGYK
jgi:hypothetical protein